MSGPAFEEQDRSKLDTHHDRGTNMGFLIGLFSVVCAFVGVFFLGRWSFGPIDDAAKSRMHPAQFSMIDLLSLVVLFQLPMAAIRWLVGEMGGDDWEQGSIWMLYGAGWLVSGLSWWTSVRTLSRAGIHNPWHRAFFVAVILPATVAGTFGAVLLPAIMLPGYVLGYIMPSLTVFITGQVFLITVCYACGRYSRYALSNVELVEPYGSAADESPTDDSQAAAVIEPSGTTSN